jgi:hypothetical protein
MYHNTFVYFSKADNESWLDWRYPDRIKQREKQKESNSHNWPKYWNKIFKTADDLKANER